MKPKSDPDDGSAKRKPSEQDTMTNAEPENSELKIDLERSDFDAVELGLTNFIKIMERDQFGALPLEDFGSGFEVKETGIYLKSLPGWLVNSLGEAEFEVLFEHPYGRPEEPVLSFPFTLKELKAFLDWAAHVGHDVPINEEKLRSVIENQKDHPKPVRYQPAPPQNQSNETLGAHVRERNRKFALQNTELSEERALEHHRWHETATQIRRERRKDISLRQLASLVKRDLNLPDALETIRKALAKHK
ncbi:MAG: hypothetical protein V7693_04530 [Halopseudomonas sabulinigri]